MTLFDFLNNYTYAMAFWGTAIIGVTAGALGCFPYLRKQSMISDVISHSALPGTLVAFLAAIYVFSVDGRNMWLLVIGAVIFGSVASFVAQFIVAKTIIKIDAAMAVTLTFFFGIGMLIMQFIDNRPLPGKGGVKDYLFGNASTIIMADLQASLIIGGLGLLIMIVFWKEFELRAFDAEYAQLAGFRPVIIDGLMFSTLVLAIVLGTKSVGLILMVAFVITPPAAARQWTRSLPGMVFLSAVIGGLSSAVGAYLSIALGRVPTGPTIVLVMFAVMVFSLLCAPRRSVLVRAIRTLRMRSALKAEVRATSATKAQTTSASQQQEGARS